MERTDRYGLCSVAGALGASLFLAAQPAFGQLQVPKCEIRVEQEGRFNNSTSDATTSDANLSATDVVDGQLRLGRNVVFADATSVSGALVGLGNGASVFDVNVFVLKLGRGAKVRGTQRPFQGGAAACEFPAVPCGGQNVVLRRGNPPRELTPGTYNSVSLENGTTLTLNDA